MRYLMLTDSNYNKLPNYDFENLKRLLPESNPHVVNAQKKLGNYIPWYEPVSVRGDALAVELNTMADLDKLGEFLDNQYVWIDTKAKIIIPTPYVPD